MSLTFITKLGLKILYRLKKLDAFGQKIELNFHKEKTHKTYYGAIITCICSIIVFSFIIEFALDIFEKRNPSVKI